MSQPRPVVLPGIILGVVLLAVAAVFAIVLPKANGETGGATGAISLPDTLPGGYTATDLEAAFDSAPAEQKAQVPTIVRSEKQSVDYGNKVLRESGVQAATRTYLGKDLQTAVVVQAFRAAGGAFAPFQFSDPKTAQAGQTVDHLVKQGDAVCIEHGTADGSGQLQGGYVECQRTDGHLTIQVTTPLALAKAAGVVDVVWQKLA